MIKRGYRIIRWGPFQNLPVEVNVKRKTTLEGRVNIYVAPEGERTIVTANARFIFKIKSSGIANFYNGFGTLVRTEPMTPGEETVSFNTNQPGVADLSDANQSIILKCFSKRKLEKEILDIVQNIN